MKDSNANEAHEAPLPQAARHGRSRRGRWILIGFLLSAVHLVYSTIIGFLIYRRPGHYSWVSIAWLSGSLLIDRFERPISRSPFDLLEGGTDAGSMLIFDPAALPDDYDCRMRHEPLEMIEPLANHGRLYWLNTCADGGYSLGVCIGGHVPAELAGFAKLLGVAAQFAAPSGKIYFAGIEYAFRRDDSFLCKHPHMGSYQEVTPGVYHLTVYEMGCPEGFHEDLWRAQASATGYRLYSLLNGGLIPLGCIAALVLAASLFWLGLRLWAITALAICLVIVLPAMVLSRTPTYRAAQSALEAIERQYPGYLAALELDCDQPATVDS